MERKEFLEINDKTYTLCILLEKRKTITASIGKKAIYFHIPISLTREEQQKEILRLKRWAEQSVKDRPPEKEEVTKQHFHGEHLQIGKDLFILNLKENEGRTSFIKKDGEVLLLSLASGLSEEKKRKHISMLISKILARMKEKEIKEKVRSLNEKHFSFIYNRICLKYHTSKWGSCSSLGNINLSTRLFFAPEEVIDYVCIHELAHLQEKNHSKKFWDLVRGAMPQYKEKRQWLKENGEKCDF